MAINQKIERKRVLNLPTSNLVAGSNYELHLGGGVYRNYVVNDSLQLVAQDGKEFIECDTVDDLRALDSRQIWAIQNGYYKGVKLNGYYTKQDTPAPIDYILSDTADVDDGGSVFEVGGVKLEHKFKSEVHLSYFGCSVNLSDNYTQAQKVLDNYKTIKLLKGVMLISKPLVVSSETVITGEGLKNSIIRKTTIDKSGLPNGISPRGTSVLYDVDSVIIVKSPDNGYAQGVTFSDFGLEHLQSQTGATHPDIENCHAIYIPFANFCSLTNVETNWSGIGFFSSSLWMSSMRNCYFRGNRVGGVRILGGTSLTIQSCWSAGCLKFAWDVNALYSNLIGCGADFIGQFPQSDPNTDPADYIYRIRGGVNLINCGTEDSKGIAISTTGVSKYPSSVINFHTLNYFGNWSGGEIFAISARSNGVLNIVGGDIRLSGATLTGKLVDVNSSSFVEMSSVHTYPPMSSSQYSVLSNSALTYGDAGGKNQVVSGNMGFQTNYGLSLSRPLYLNASWNGARLMLQQGAGSFQTMNIWHSAARAGTLMYKSGTTAQGGGVPTSDTDGMVLTSNTDRGLSTARPIGIPTGYLFYETDTKRLMVYDQGGVWVPASGLATTALAGGVKQAVAVPNGSSIDDLLAALRTAGIIAT